MMGNIMYLHQALQQPDAREFVKAIIKEVNGHIDNNHWKLIPRTEVPEGIEVIPSVWAMWRKRDLMTGRVTKHKARLNLHGWKQEFGTNYYETYAPVVTWFAIRLLIVFGILFNWDLCQVDFVMAYPQAPIKMDMDMELPTGIHTKHWNSKDHILKLLANIYGQKQASACGTVTSSPSYGRSTSSSHLLMFASFTKMTSSSLSTSTMESSWDHWTLDQQIRDIINKLHNLKLSIEDQGHLADYVGVSIKKLKNGIIELTQWALINSIISDVALDDSKVKAVPAKVSKILHAHLDKSLLLLNFGYQSVIGKLDYLAQITRPDIVYATHQLAKYSSGPREPHGEAVLYLIRYLKKTLELDTCFKPDQDKGFECYCDADFSGNWNKHFTPFDPSTAKSCSC